MTEEIGEFPSEEDEDFTDKSPLDVYLHLRRHEMRPGYKRSITTSWHRLEDWLEEEDYELFDVGFDEAMDFAEWLDNEIPRTAGSYMDEITGVITRLSSEGYIKGSNPFDRAERAYTFTSPDERATIEVPFETLVEGVLEIRRPSIFAAVCLMLKSGIRIGSLVNLDDRDVHLEHPISKLMDSPRPAIRDKPNSIHIDSDIVEGEVYNGEERLSSVKKKSTRTIPIDSELTEILGWYRSLRVESASPANPFFVNGGGKDTEANIGSRASKQYIRMGMYDWADQYAWGEDLYPHWCRHWWTTQMRANVDPGDVTVGSKEAFIKGLRGDSEGDTIETYTHHWEEGLEIEDPKSYSQVVREAIPKFLH